MIIYRRKRPTSQPIRYHLCSPRPGSDRTLCGLRLNPETWEAVFVVDPPDAYIVLCGKCKERIERERP